MTPDPAQERALLRAHIRRWRDSANAPEPGDEHTPAEYQWFADSMEALLSAWENGEISREETHAAWRALLAGPRLSA